MLKNKTCQHLEDMHNSMNQITSEWCYTIKGENQFKVKIRPVDFNIMDYKKKKIYWYEFRLHIATKL